MSPRIAWPTVALAGAALGAEIGCVLAAAAGAPLHLIVPVATVACFVGFTPVHESAHHNLAADRRLNDVVGHLCAALILGALLPYRYLHGQHHAHTNAPGADPDHWGSRAAAPLRWLTQDVGYLWFYAQRWSARPVAERVNLIACGVGYAAVLAIGWTDPAWRTALVWGWLVPARLALWLLAWSFAWVPHAPHVATDPLHATTVDSRPILTWLLLGQNFHLLHHLKPRVPFYALSARWARDGAALCAAGAVDRAPGRSRTA